MIKNQTLYPKNKNNLKRKKIKFKNKEKTTWTTFP